MGAQGASMSNLMTLGTFGAVAGATTLASYMQGGTQRQANHNYLGALTAAAGRPLEPAWTALRKRPRKRSPTCPVSGSD